jgi:hypothetical protein
MAPFDWLVRRIAEVDAWHAQPRPVEMTREWLWDGDDSQRRAAVDAICARRTAILRHDRVRPLPVAIGRFLVFDPGQSLSDGAAALESNGLFDDDNVPAASTWVAFVEEPTRSQGRWMPFQSYLLCWIPDTLVDAAQRGIVVNPEECIRWAEAVDAPFLVELWRAL